MLVEKPACKRLWKSDTLRVIARGTLVALIVSVSTVLVSQLLGLPAPPGVGAVLGVVCASSWLAGK